MRYRELLETDTITMWHGGRDLESSYGEVRSHSGGRWEHGPGLYLTTHHDTAAKYAKGGGKVYKVTVQKGRNIDDVYITLEDAMGFVNRYVKGTKRKEMEADLRANLSRRKSDSLPIETLVNLSLNRGTISNTNTGALRQFLIDHGVDYVWVNRYGGRDEKVLVVVNPKNIKRVQVIPAKDVDPAEYQLNVEEDVELDESSRSAPLYHLMGFDKTINVFGGDIMFARWSHVIPGMGEVRGNSFTRNSKLSFGSDRFVKLTIDQSKLAETHKIVPLDGEAVFRHTIKVSDDPTSTINAVGRGDRQMNDGKHTLAEEFVVGHIKQLHKYITSVHLNRLNYSLISGMNSIRLLDVVETYCKKWNIPLTVDPQVYEEIDEIKQRWADDEEDEEDLVEADTLTELFDNSLPFEWLQRSPDYYRGVFNVDDREYSLVCRKEKYYHFGEQDLPDFWELYFIPSDNSFDDGALNVKEPFKVFATVITRFKEFIERQHPAYVQFTGDATAPARVKLYNSLARAFAAELKNIGYDRCASPEHRDLKPNSDYFSLTFKGTQ